jgi:RHS repeat-associated protein
VPLGLDRSGAGAAPKRSAARAVWAYQRNQIRRNVWHGILLEDKRDAAGTLYRRNRYYDSATGRFTQEDPIGLAGGLNLYGYASGDPVNFWDPFGLRDVYVGCRPLDDDNVSKVGQHCAVKIVDKDGKTEIYELLNRGNKNQAGAPANEEEAALYAGTSWRQVGVPSNMSSEQFDESVRSNAQSIGAARAGRTYLPLGAVNSNRYVYDVVRASGGRVPFGAVIPGLYAPGICGGFVLGTGNNCTGYPRPTRPVFGGP